MDPMTETTPEDIGRTTEEMVKLHLLEPVVVLSGEVPREGHGPTKEFLDMFLGVRKEMRDAHNKGEELGLTDDEIAFYDALETNDSAVKVLGDETLMNIAKELVDTVRKNASIDWTLKESARAKLRVLAKKVLKVHGYPPDKQAKATITVLEQAELLCRDWVAA